MLFDSLLIYRPQYTPAIVQYFVILLHNRLQKYLCMSYNLGLNQVTINCQIT